MTVLRIATVLIVAVCAGSSAISAPAQGSHDWPTYGLVDVRNRESPVVLIEYEHHRTRGDAVIVQTRLLLRTGSHWIDATPHGMTWGIDDVYFVDRRHGWVVTNDCAAGKGAMYRTRDGGRTWRRLAWGFTHGCAAGSGFRLVFVDRSDGWVIHPEPTGPGGSIYRTQDGGRTWKYRPTSPNGFPVLDEAVFTTPRRGWAIGLSWLYAGPLYKTSNSGRTWKPVLALPRARYSVPAVFRRTSVVMGMRRGVATFYRTADGGGRWTAVARLDLHGLHFPDFRAPTKDMWWVYGVRSSTPVALVTSNGGQTWSTRTLPGHGDYVELAVTRTRSWLTTTPLQGAGAFYSSGDLGRTWSRVSP